MTLLPVKFTDLNGGVSRVKDCRSPLAIASLLICARTYCTEKHRIEGIDIQNATCQNSMQTPLPSWDFIANYTDDDVVRMPKFEKAVYDSGGLFSSAVIPSAHLFSLAYDTLQTWSYVFGHHIIYGLALFIFWGCVVAVGLGSHLLPALSQPGTTKRTGWQNIPLDEPDEAGEPSRNSLVRASRLYTWIQRRLTIPATFGYRTSQPFGWYTVPPRIQSLTIFAFVAMNIFFCAYGYHVFEDNLYFPEVHTQAWRYFSDRTGIISFANFPLIWLFGMRNNVLMWVTGWDFGTYNNFHRWVARVSTVQAVAHSIGYTFLVFDRGGWPLFWDYWKEFWWATGEVATVLMCALIPLSLYWMRRNAYELFLLLHIGLSIIILVSMWGHIVIFKGHYSDIVWICAAIWALDRILRMLRTLSFNRLFWTTRARATYDPDANMIRLSIPFTKSLYRPNPGTYYYLHLLNDRRFWESHPFTMAGVQEQDDSKMAEASTADQPIFSHEAASLLPRAEPNIPLVREYSHPHGVPSEPMMTFLIRPYDSFTKRLQDAAYRSYPQPAYLPMLIEGPYGHTQSFNHFDRVTFIVGGSGIVVPLVHLDTIGRGSGNKKVSIIWAVRELGFAESVLQQDLASSQDAFDSGRLSLDIYVTGAQGVPQWEGLPKEARIHYGRPDITTELEDEIREHGLNNSIAVVSCGPAKMNDDARKAVVDALDKREYALEYFQESFNW